MGVSSAMPLWMNGGDLKLVGSVQRWPVLGVAVLPVQNAGLSQLRDCLRRPVLPAAIHVAELRHVLHMHACARMKLRLLGTRCGEELVIDGRVRNALLFGCEMGMLRLHRRHALND